MSDSKRKLNILDELELTEQPYKHQTVVAEMIKESYPLNDMSEINGEPGKIPPSAPAAEPGPPKIWKTKEDILTALGFIPGTETPPSGHIGAMRLKLD